MNQPKRSHREDYLKLPRSPLVNISKGVTAKIADQAEPKHGIGDFLDRYLFQQVVWFFKTTFHVIGWSKYKFATYDAGDKNNGVYKLQSASKGSVKIALAADWATDTAESIKVAECMAGHNPDYTIHMGDTYYIGNSEEINDNFLCADAPWKKGTLGSFALLGNHEMYATGKPYFTELLPTLGITDSSGNMLARQKAAFFCLENDYWRVIGIDTGYNSVNFLSFFGFTTETCELEKSLIDWLEKEVKLGSDNRGIIFLSHHQYCSAFNKKQYSKPGQQLKKYLQDRKVIWLWGHEHCFSAYSKYNCDGGITAYGRCIGNGGMPVELSPFDRINHPDVLKNNLVMYDKRENTSADLDVKVGFNGYTTIEVDNQYATIAYFDINGKLLEEKWEADIKAGLITGMLQYMDKSLTINAGHSFNDMVTP